MTVRPALERSFRDHALDQGALLALRAGRGVAADLPVAMHRPHRALRAGSHGQAEKQRERQACGGQACARQAAEAAGKWIAAACGASHLVFPRPHRVDPMIFPWQC